MLCISGFVRDVNFSDMSIALQRRRCSVKLVLTPLLRDNWLCPALDDSKRHDCSVL